MSSRYRRSRAGFIITGTFCLMSSYHRAECGRRRGAGDKAVSVFVPSDCAVAAACSVSRSVMPKGLQCEVAVAGGVTKRLCVSGALAHLRCKSAASIRAGDLFVDAQSLHAARR